MQKFFVSGINMPYLAVNTYGSIDLIFRAGRPFFVVHVRAYKTRTLRRRRPTVCVNNPYTVLPIQSMSEMATAGQLLAQSGMFGISNAAAGFVVVATCQQQGISLMAFSRTYHIVQGKPTMRADAMLAEFRKLGGKVKIIENSTTCAHAVLEFEGESYDWKYTIEDAKRTGDALNGDGSLKNMWQKRPEDMLWARLVSRSIRKLAPEIVSGIYTPEETQDAQSMQRGEPRRINPSEIDDRVKHNNEPDLNQYAKREPHTIDIDSDMLEEANYCPIGGDDYRGLPWAQMPDDVLEMALESKLEEITEAHRDAIRLELSKRNEVI